jgi:hypothetical protein
MYKERSSHIIRFVEIKRDCVKIPEVVTDFIQLYPETSEVLTVEIIIKMGQN